MTTDPEILKYLGAETLRYLIDKNDELAKTYGMAAGGSDDPYSKGYYERSRAECEERSRAFHRELVRRPDPHPQEREFLNALRADDEDELTRNAYADWLLENDRPEGADRQRAWVASKKWMMSFLKEINYGPYVRDPDGNPVEDEDGNYVKDTDPDNIGGPHQLYDAIEAGFGALSGDGYTWSSDAGSDYFNTGDPEKSREFFKHWQVLTGAPLPAESVVEDPPFRCAC